MKTFTSRGMLVLFAAAAAVAGCSNIEKTIGTYKEMKVQTKTSTAIFVDPVSRERRTIYLDVRSGVEGFDRHQFREFVVKQFAANDNAYRIVDDPDAAQFTMAVLVLNLEETTADAAQAALSKGYSRRAPEKKQSLTEMFTGKNTSSKKTIALVCDVQIRERAAEGVMVRKDSAVNARVADAGSSRQTVSEVTDRKEYRTRIVTVATGTNFDLVEVQGEMFQKTATAMSGFF